jgi:hypothetical protein
MIIHYSGAESRYGKLLDDAILHSNLMMTFITARGGASRFWELKECREKSDVDLLFGSVGRNRMLIYYSGVPGIEGGLPEELLDGSCVMSSRLEMFGKNRAVRRMQEITQQRENEDADPGERDQ